MCLPTDHRGTCNCRIQITLGNEPQCVRMYVIAQEDKWGEGTREQSAVELERHSRADELVQ